MRAETALLSSSSASRVMFAGGLQDRPCLCQVSYLGGLGRTVAGQRIVSIAGAGQLIARVIRVGPGLGTRALAALGDVAFVIIGVHPAAIVEIEPEGVLVERAKVGNNRRQNIFNALVV